MNDEDDIKSTLIRQGEAATTFREMIDFADSLDSRPLTKLLEELPGLAKLSDSKFNLSVKVLRKRFRSEAEINRTQLRSFADEIASREADPDIATRIRELFTDIR